MTELKKYFYNDFPSQLRKIVAGKKTVGFDEKYVFIGGHEWKNFEKDMQKIPVENRPEFLLSLFMIILTDQAVYTYEKDLHRIWRENTMFPNFGHWGFGPHNENPLWILAKADTDDGLSKNIQTLIPEFTKFLVDETTSYFTQIFGDKIDLPKYFAAILGDNSYQGGYQLKSSNPETEELRNSKCVAMFKQYFESELKTQGFI